MGAENQKALNSEFPETGAFEARPPSFLSRINHTLSHVLTEGGDEVVPENAAPDWAVKDVIYNRWQGKRFLTGKVVGMVFCATWCVPCQWEVEAWKELHRTYAVKGLRIVGLFADSTADIRTFVATHQLANLYPCAPASDAILWKYGIYPTGRLPFFALVNRNGILITTMIGYHPKNYYEEAIVSVL